MIMKYADGRKRTPPDWAPKTKIHQCLKCNKKWELSNTGDRVKQTTLFCKSCATTYSNMGLSLIDEYLSKEFNYYQPKGPYILKCKCGVSQTYSTKYCLVRVLQTSGTCGKCSRSANRDWTNITQEYRDYCILRGYNRVYETSFNTLNEFNSWFEAQPIDRKYKTYRREVENKSKKNLKRYSPREYERWEKNKWDGTDMNQLTIDHDKEVWECFRDNWTVSQASHYSNLVVMTMKENIEKHRSKLLNGSDPKLLKSQKEKIPHHQNFW
jgi:hypothetical protein